MQRLKNKKGFTLVELSLSIAFIAILSITIALIINDAISTYRRGLTLNQINTVGMDLVDDMRAAIQNSPAKVVAEICDEVFKGNGSQETSQRNNCKSDGGRKFVSIVKASTNSDKVKIKGEEKEGVPLYGAFCTGAYSYVWNSGYLFTEDNSSLERASLSYKYDGTEENPNDFRLIKVRDENRKVCRSGLVEGDSKYDEFGTNQFEVGEITEEPVVLLSGSGDTANALALYDLSVPAPAADGVNAAFYAVSFILGTVQGGINVMSSGNFCATPDEYDSNFDYCAINKFNFAAQANGG
ncbi:hypothetical protein IIY68_02160 [Candidatus Saccharibacteria bacterium]|nr:hypothetical protein [Candidatus Saccharibacteria bacterium]